MTTCRAQPPSAPPSPCAFTLGRRTVLHLAPDQGLSTLTVRDEAWADLGGVPAFGHGRVLSIFDYESTWSWWERHPGGDELVLVLSGRVRLHLDDGAPMAVALSAGEATLVPRGTWHRAEIVEPSRMLFVTPAPAQTEHRDA